MSQGKDLRLGKCFSCNEVMPLAEIKLVDGRIIGLCEKCLESPYYRVKRERYAREKRDKAEGDRQD